MTKYKTGKCLFCKKEFIKHEANSKFCSKDCYRDAVKSGWRADYSRLKAPVNLVTD